MIRQRALPSLFGLLVLVLASTVHAQTRTQLYNTDFSDFPAGDGQLVGNDGWLSTHPDEMVHGTVDDFFGQGNRRATIGYFAPNTGDKIISVYRPINYDPIEANTPVIDFSASVAIVDSNETTFYDSFHISVFNSSGDLLASVVFDNTEENFGIWRADGEGFFGTGVSFEHEVLYQLRLRIDFAANTWTASLDDTVLFTSAPFSKSNAVRNLGDFSAEWEITDIDNPGDNWLLFDDWAIHAVSNSQPPVTGSPIAITSITRRPNGRISLRWPATAGARYQIETSDDLTQWRSDLPDSLVSPDPQSSTAEWTDRRAGNQLSRYYRVRSL